MQSTFHKLEVDLKIIPERELFGEEDIFFHNGK
jgi:hypothetical protein